MTQNPTLLRSALVVLALGLAAPAAAQTTRRAPPPSSSQAVLVGPLIGMELDGDGGLALRGDAVVPLSRLSGSATLDGVLSVGLTFFSDDNGRFGPDVDTTIFKVIPALRLTAPLTPTVGVYGDVGLGFYYGSTTVDSGTFGDQSFDDDGFGVGMRFAGGLFADVSPRVRVGGEIGLNPYFGQYDDTTLSLLVSLMFRL